VTVQTTVQVLLPTEQDSPEPESAYDVGHRHGITGSGFYNDPIPKQQRRDYARGYTRGALARARADRLESA
jgi:hypothetical protein